MIDYKPKVIIVCGKMLCNYKIIKSHQPGWAELPHTYNIHRIVLYGDLYAHRLAKNVNNKFLADVARRAEVFLENLTPKISVNKFVNSPLWHDSHLSFQYRQDRANKGYCLIKDILDKQGDLK